MPVTMHTEDGKMLCSQRKFVCNLHLGSLLSQIGQRTDHVSLHLLAIYRCDLNINTVLTLIRQSLYIPTTYSPS